MKIQSEGQLEMLERATKGFEEDASKILEILGEKFQGSTYHQAHYYGRGDIIVRIIDMEDGRTNV